MCLLGFYLEIAVAAFFKSFPPHHSQYSSLLIRRMLINNYEIIIRA
jgi:hypothetical protein